MAKASLKSNPVFIDVAAQSEQYPITADCDSTTAPQGIEEVKLEEVFKQERSNSPLSSYLKINKRRIRCKECPKFTAENEEKMQRHVRKMHRGENPFQCYMCDYTTYNKSLFEEHVRIHQGIKPFKCSHCPYRSASKKNTKKHELIHRPDNPHKCKLCGFIARHLKSLKCHLKLEHSESKTSVANEKNKTGKSLTPCPACKRKVENLEIHEKRRISCQECEVKLCNKNLVRKHMLATHNDKNKVAKGEFVCAICQWSSNVKPKILLHLIHHPKQRVDETVVDLQVLKDCGIVGEGW